MPLTIHDDRGRSVPDSSLHDVLAKRHVVVCGRSSRCGHCVRMEPAMRQFCDGSRAGGAYVVDAVDESIDTLLETLADVDANAAAKVEKRLERGVPLVFGYRTGAEPFWYSGDRSARSLAEFSESSELCGAARRGAAAAAAYSLPSSNEGAVLSAYRRARARAKFLSDERSRHSVARYGTDATPFN